MGEVFYLDTFRSANERSYEVCEVSNGLSRYRHIDAEKTRKDLQKGYMKLLAEFKNN